MDRKDLTAVVTHLFPVVVELVVATDHKDRMAADIHLFPVAAELAVATGRKDLTAVVTRLFPVAVELVAAMDHKDRTVADTSRCHRCLFLEMVVDISAASMVQTGTGMGSDTVGVGSVYRTS